MGLTDFACTCGGSIGNTQTPPCVKKFELAIKDIYLNAFAADGTRNSIPASAFVNGVLPESFILGKLNEADPTKRWYLTPDRFEEQAPARTDNQTVESGTGTIKQLRNGVKTAQYELWDVPAVWAGQLNKGKCIEMAVFKIDESESIAVEASVDGTEFYPLLIEKSTLIATPFEATPDKVAYTQITYQLSRSVQEGLVITLASDEYEGSLLSAKSLIEVDLKQDPNTPTNTDTQLFVQAESIIYGTAANSFKLLGATDPSQWSVSNGGVAVAVSGVIEYGDGRYELLINSNPSATLDVSYVTIRTSLSAFGYVSDSVALVTP